MILTRDFFIKAGLERNKYGYWQTTIFTPPEMIEEIKEINEDYRKNYGLDEDEEDFIKIIDDEKEFIKESMADFDNNEEIQKSFNYDREVYRKTSEKLFKEYYKKLKQSLQDDIKKNRMENDI